MKILGALLVIFSGTGIGWLWGYFLRKRVKTLNDMIQIFQWLGTEIGYASVPLPEAFGKIGDRVRSETGMVASIFARSLASPEGLTADEAWQQSLEKCREELPLDQEDWKVLADFGRTLGVTDRNHQVKAIQETLEKLKIREEEARKTAEKNERIYRYLGMATGALVALVFY